MKFSTQLQEAGFSQRQADTLTKGLQEALTATVATAADLAPIQAKLNHIATKTDTADLRSEMAELRTEMSVNFQDVAKGFAAVYRMMAGFALTFMGTIIGATIALIRYLAP